VVHAAALNRERGVEVRCKTSRTFPGVLRSCNTCRTRVRPIDKVQVAQTHHQDVGSRGEPSCRALGGERSQTALSGNCTEVCCKTSPTCSNVPLPLLLLLLSLEPNSLSVTRPFLPPFDPPSFDPPSFGILSWEKPAGAPASPDRFTLLCTAAHRPG
jgi:hypothetical protein